jgi:hypothetical protein
MNLKLLSSPTPAGTRCKLKLLGVVILAAGLGAAASIWLAQDRIDRQRGAGGAEVTGPLSPEDSRRYTHDVELYYGATGLLMEKWQRWWEEWTHGKPLAKVIATGSLFLAAACFYLAARFTRLTALFRATAPPAPPNPKPPAADGP